MDVPLHPTDPQIPALPLTADGLSSLDIRPHLERVLASRCLSNAPGQRQFLRFVVEETLAGRGQELKEYVIGVQALGRPATFDPRMDPSVRVAAGRMRQKLDDYYASEGQNDEVVIVLDRGAYRPEFKRRLAVEPASPRPVDLPPARRPWKVWAGILAGVMAVAVLVFWIRGRQDPLMPSGGVIAVLPFANATADPGTDYVCFGVVEDLTTQLTGIEGMRVIARTSATQFGAKGLDLVDVGRRLGAQYLIEGSVRRDGTRLLVTAQLIETRKGTHLWAHSYEREVAEGVTAQQQVAGAIADAVRQHLGRRATRGRLTSRAVSGEGLDLYWKGRYVRAQRTPESLPQAIAFFEQAVTRNPSHVESRAALGEALAAEAFRQTAPSGATVDRARSQFQQALVLDPDSARALAALAWVQFFYDHDWPAAQTNFTRALDLNPSAAESHNLYALALAAHGRFDEASRHSYEALRLDPIRYATSTDNAVVLWCARRYDETLAACQRSLDAVPDHHASRLLRGMAYLGKRAYPEARADFQAVRQALGPVSALLGRLGYAEAVTGQTTAARKILREMEGLAPAGEIAFVHLAYVHAGLGERDQAMACLERAEARHEADLNFVAVEPAFDGLRNEPRFIRLLERLHHSLK